MTTLLVISLRVYAKCVASEILFLNILGIHGIVRDFDKLKRVIGKCF